VSPLANILSQNEIDELLSVLTSGKDIVTEAEQPQTSDQKVRVYDFRTANKFSKEQIRTLHFIYDNYASRMSTFLSGMLRAICEVQVLSIEEQTFSELSNSMPSPVVATIISMPPLEGSALFLISSAVAYEIVSRLLGGTGEKQAIDKPFTEIELSIMERVIKNMLGIMSEAWEKINKVNAQLERIETSSQYVQIVSANEPIAIITMKVSIGDTADIINICLPHVALQPIAKKLVMQSWYNEVKVKASDGGNVGQNLSKVYITLNAVFNETQATVKDILNTEVGDVIQVNHNINMPVTVKIEHIPKFRGFVGMHGSNYAVKVTDILKEEIFNDADNGE
jgi:flagellar motor switch protein FliM